MGNIINNITSDSSIKARALQAELAAKLNLNRKDKATPVDPDGYMLPSKIFGSPKRYVNNLKKDIVTIKNGAKGKANDHELGRLNDLAMKTGSLLLATYLFATKPFKTSKAMEFVGFGTFFASMALWPKLFIQAPLKARTGVDVHRRYVDSFGREKMFFQDPQYVPWALMKQEEIDKMGDKLGIPKDIPDRNAVIQDTARKTAVQANTLWMYTAGLATPLMSALSCSVIEKPVDKAIRNSSLKRSQKHLDDLSLTMFQKLKKNFNIKSNQRFLSKMSDAPLTPDTIDKIAKRLGNSNIALTEVLNRELTEMAQNSRPKSVPLNKDTIKTIINKAASQFNINGVDVNVEGLVTSTGVNCLSSDNAGEIAKYFANTAAKGDVFKQKEFRRSFTTIIEDMLKSQSEPKVSAISEPLGKLSDIMANFKAKSGILDRFFDVRTKKLPGTLLGTEYTAFSNEVIDALGLKGTKKILTDDDVIEQLEKFVASDRFEGTVKSLEARIERFHKEFDTTGVFRQIDKALEETSEQLKGAQFGTVAEKLTGFRTPLKRTFKVLGFETMEEITRDSLAKNMYAVFSDEGLKNALLDAFYTDTNISIPSWNTDKLKRLIENAFEGSEGSTRRALRTEAEMRIVGSESSFYRTLQTLDVFKRISSGTFREDLKKVVVDSKKVNLSEDELDKAIEYAKRLLAKGTIVDYSDKAKYTNLIPDKKINDAVMEVLFNDAAYPMQLGSENLRSCIRGYKAEFKARVIDVLHNIEAPINNRDLDKSVEYMQGIVKHNMIGEPIVDAVKSGVQSIKNSNKWARIFVSAFGILVGVTLIAGTQFGKRKDTGKAEGVKANE